MSTAESKKTKEQKKDEKPNMNDIAQSAMGDFGTWQVVICLWISAVKLPIAWNQLGIVFLAAPVPFHCAGSKEQCFNNASEPCTSWEYDYSVFKSTIISEWDLVCNRSQLVNVTQMITMIGILVGNIIFSIAADRYGRKLPLVLSGQIQMLTGVVTTFCPWFSIFLLMRFLQSIAVGGCMTISFVLCMEILGGRWRAIISTLTHIPFNIGHMTMVGIAYWTRDWRCFQLATSLPSLFMLFYWWLIPESPRWLLATGQNEKAIKILQVAAKKNRNQIPESITFSNKEKKQLSEETESKANILDLLRTKNMRKKTFAMCINWTSCGLCFYGLAQYVGQFGGNIFINVAVSGSLVIPGMLLSIVMMDKLGRKPALIGGQLIAGVCCFAIMLFPKNAETSNVPRVALASLGILGTGIAFCTVYLYSGELFPTVVRNIGVGSGSMCARIGSMAAPFIASLSQYNYYLSPLLFGLMPLISAAVSLVLPETLNSDLPQTLEEGEEFGKRHKHKSNGSANLGFQNDNMVL